MRHHDAVYDHSTHLELAQDNRDILRQPEDLVLMHEPPGMSLVTPQQTRDGDSVGGERGEALQIEIGDSIETDHNYCLAGYPATRLRNT